MEEHLKIINILYIVQYECICNLFRAILFVELAFQNRYE